MSTEKGKCYNSLEAEILNKLYSHIGAFESVQSFDFLIKKKITSLIKSAFKKSEDEYICFPQF